MRLYLGTAREFLLFKFGLIRADQPIGPIVRINVDLKVFKNLSKQRQFVADLDTAQLGKIHYVYSPLHK